MWPDCARDPDGLALLRAAVANPHEQTPRLLLADWLQEQGEDEVAGLIRSGWHSFDKLSTDVRERWLPWNECRDGWLGINCDEAGLGNLADVADPAWVTWCWLPLNRPQATTSAVRELERFTNLVILHCSLCDEFSDADLAALPALPNLTTLGLTFTNVTDAGLTHLVRFSNLTDLELNYCHKGLAGPYLSREAVRELQAALPNCRIEWLAH